jgi:cytochrome c oxidase subunit 2
VAAVSAAIAAAAALGYGVAASAQTAPAEKHEVQLIKVTARRWAFSPNNLVLKKGQPVDIELHTEDVLMGFNVPGFNTRADILPGQVIHVRLVPDKTGTFTFLCDIFCGSGHEDMNGTITVVE